MNLQTHYLKADVANIVIEVSVVLELNIEGLEPNIEELSIAKLDTMVLAVSFLIVMGLHTASEIVTTNKLVFMVCNKIAAIRT